MVSCLQITQTAIVIIALHERNQKEWEKKQIGITLHESFWCKLNEELSKLHIRTFLFFPLSPALMSVIYLFAG